MFGQNLKQVRESRGLSQAELARILNTSRQNINRYERNEHEPTIKTVAEFARVLNVSVTELTGIQTPFHVPPCDSASLPYISPEEFSLLSAYRSADPADRIAVDAILSKYQERKKEAAG